MNQNFKNMPAEIAKSRRFFPVAENKVPLQKNWANPENQKSYPEIQGLAGFDTCGHGVNGSDYLFLDFDHVLDSEGKFVDSDAAKMVEYIKTKFPEIYIEKSKSGTGLHVFMIPSVGTQPISNSKEGVLYFCESREKNAPKLEFFYGSGGRYCLVTGNVFVEGSKIPAGAVVDNFLAFVLEGIQQQLKAAVKPASAPVDTQDPPVYQNDSAGVDTQNNPVYQADLARACLQAINPARLEYSDWLAVMSACKNAGIDYSTVDSWNRQDASRYNEVNNQNHWNSLSDSSYGLPILIRKATDNGFIVKVFKRQWQKDNPQYSSRSFNNSKPDSVVVNNFLPDQPIKLELPAGFEIGSGKLLFGKEIISCTPPLVTKKLWQGDRVFYEVSFLVDNQWKKTIVKAGELANKQEILKLADFGLDINSINANKMCRYFVFLIGENAAKIPIETAYSQGGWDDACNEFIYPNDKTVFGNNFDYAAAFKIAGNEEQFNKLLLNVLKQSAVACLVVGTALAAPLIQPLSISNKQLHLGCRSGNGKTALVKLALAIFGNPKYLMAKFNATANALENFSAALNCFPSAIDELQSINKFQRDCVDELLYNFESGSIRRRLTKQANFQPVKYFYGCRITTGEQPLTTEFSNEGAKKRCVEISESELLDDDLAVEVHQLTSENYGFYGRYWCDFVKQRKESIKEAYNELFKDLQRQHRRSFPEHISLITVAQVALKNFCELFFDSLSVETVLDTFDVDRIFGQLPTRQEMQNGKRAILSVAEFCTIYKAYFSVINSEGVVDREDHAPPAVFGYVLKNGNILIFPQKLKECLKEFPNFQAIVRDFSELGYLDEGKDKTRPHQKAVKLEGKTIWGYIFKAAVLFYSDSTCELKHQEEIQEEDFTEPPDNGYDFEEEN